MLPTNYIVQIIPYQECSVEGKKALSELDEKIAVLYSNFEDKTFRIDFLVKLFNDYLEIECGEKK
jgi:hypothetical protein